jgi:hypothetical protein
MVGFMRFWCENRWLEPKNGGKSMDFEWDFSKLKKNDGFFRFYG